VSQAGDDDGTSYPTSPTLLEVGSSSNPGETEIDKKKEAPQEEEEDDCLPKELSVLFVDDDRVLRKLFSRSIKRSLPGWKVQETSSGETAIRLVDTESFDLIFMDQYMASTEKQLLGTEATRELRAKEVTSKICGLSANEKRDAFLNAGADGFMLKHVPCSKDELKRSLLELLND
jgi:CheY-like chemotaxis protein